MDYRAKLARRAQVWAQMQEIQARSNLVEAEDRRQWDELEGELTNLSEAIEREERSAKYQAIDAVDDLGAPQSEDRDDAAVDAYATAFRAYLERGMGSLGVEQRELLMSSLVELPAEIRAQAAGTAALGGYAVPQGFWNKVTETMKAYGGLLGIANVLPTDSGNTIPWPTVDDTANEGYLVSENAAMADAPDIAYAQNSLGAYMFSSRPIRASIQFLQDTATDSEAFIARLAGVRIGRALSGYLATGTGTSQPKGVTSFAVGKQGAVGQTASITYDDALDVVHSVNPAYRGARCRWAMADSSLKVFRKLKDSTGRPLWEPSLQLGQPDTLLGYAVTIDDKMPAMAASAKSIAFGDFESGLVVRAVNGGGLIRLEERYADSLQVGFIAFGRYDSTIDDAAAVRLYQNSAT